MTTQTETLKTSGKPAKQPAQPGYATSFAAILGLAAITVWLSGVALNKGYGVHLPFVAGFILLLGGLQVVKLAANEVASTWHNHAIAAASRLAAADVAGAYIAEKEIEAAEEAGALMHFTDRMMETFPEKVDGAYL